MPISDWAGFLVLMAALPSIYGRKEQQT